MPPIGLITGRVDFSDKFLLLKDGAKPGPYTTLADAKQAGAVVLGYGQLLNAVISFVMVALALFYFARGPIGSGRSGGQRIERFTYFERAAHWTNATAFVILAISGVVMAFGQFLLMPLLGSTLFGWLTYGLKTLHNFAGPVFAVTLVIVLLTFIRDELFVRADWVDLAWSLFTPLLEAWATSAPNDIPNYPAGTWGPPAADALTDNRRWRNE